VTAEQLPGGEGFAAFERETPQSRGASAQRVHGRVLSAQGERRVGGLDARRRDLGGLRARWSLCQVYV
jgi:hypothetical protein